MIKISNSSMLHIFTKLLILLAVAKSISLSIWWYLPSDGVELTIKENYQPAYRRVDFSVMVLDDTVTQTTGASQTTTKNVSNGLSITDMILKGLYGINAKGYVIVAMKSNPATTSIIAVGEVFSGYTLKSILIDSVIFEKTNQEYILSLEKMDDSSSITKVKKAASSEAPKDVSRQDIAYYAKDPKQIWKDISLVEVKDGANIKGFKVTKITPNSKFALLGLEQGDVIIKANNIELKSYRDALEIYKNINKIDTVQIVVMRNNQEKELVYEIN